MEEFIEIIISYLKKYKRPVVNLLNQGLSRSSIEQKIGRVGLEFPDDYFKLFGMYNGTLVNEGDILDDLHFFPGYYFLSIEDSKEYYNILLNSGSWNKNWFPLFASGGGDYFCIDCTKENRFPIIGYIIGYYEDDLRDFLNLSSMFKTIAECYKHKAYFLDKENGYLEADIEKERTIARKYNFGLQRWL